MFKSVKLGFAVAAMSAMVATSYAVNLNSALFPDGSGTKVQLNNGSHILQGTVVVAPTCTLEIAPGARIYGTNENTAIETSILIIAKGAHLIAEGTIDSPIVFTVWEDKPGQKDDFGPGAKGLWGGIIWVGDAITSLGTDKYPEGIPTGLPSYVRYGGTNASYNGGKMKYVSIRHGGVAVTSGSETNGISACALGSETEISYVEIFANSDDGIEFFGGSVNTHHMAMLFNNDDAFDIDEGYNGKNQFWFAIEQEYDGDHGGEWDGRHPSETGAYSAPTIYNYTFIGSGCYNLKSGDPIKNACLGMRDQFGGEICNGIIAEFAGFGINRHVHNNGLPQDLGSGLEVKGNIFFNVADGSWGGIVNPGIDIPYMSANNYITTQQMLSGIGRRMNNNLDPRLNTLSRFYTPNPWSVGVPEPAGLVNVNYVGAFDSTDLWIDKWTAAYELGCLTTQAGPHSYDLSVHLGSSTVISGSSTNIPFEINLRNGPLDPTFSASSMLWNDPRFKVYIDGHDMTSNLGTLGATQQVVTATAHHVRIRVYLPVENLLVPSAGAWRTRNRVGPHVVNVVVPVRTNNYPADPEFVLTASNMVQIY